MDSMPGMGEKRPAGHVPRLIQDILSHAGSGTSLEPASVRPPMLMKMKGKWMFMLHGVAFLADQQQSGPRGFDKAFSPNWIMPMAQHPLGPGMLTLRTMLSFEPATVSQRRYPEIFQVGETAYGKPIVDGQHPHDFVMELAALYDLPLGRSGLLSFYVAPVGDPAMGPVAFPHRAAAAENPLAALGHHLEDSTHISDDVVTVGATYKIVRLEASGFHGREPDEFRWDIGAGRIDSWSSRLTVQPAKNWSLQYSFGHLTSPEALNPGEDVQRMTASLSYNRPLRRGSWSSTLVWGRNHQLNDGENFNGYLLDSTLHLGHNNTWTRIENVDRTNLLLLGENTPPPGFTEHFLARVQGYTFGYDREFDLGPHLSAALGGQFTFYGKPGFLTPTYGDHPVGGAIFLRIRPVGASPSDH